MSAVVRTGLPIFGPDSGNSTSIPIPGSVIRISLNRIAASKPS